MSSEKEDGVCEIKLCDNLDKCSISNSTRGIGLSIDNNNNNIDDVSICANCGKEGSDDDMNTCNKCKLVKYCNAACKKKHRSKHKKQCERRVAELHDIELFKQPPPEEDCPICFLRMPTLHTGSTYKTCCGKTICSGCIHAPLYDNQGNLVDINKQNECPFCRVVAPKSDEEGIKRFRKRVELNDPLAIYNLGCAYRDGLHGYPQDRVKALELWHRSGELGFALSYGCIGYAYENGIGVELDKEKAEHYYEIAAIGGSVVARYNLGRFELQRDGNLNRALRHWMIAIRDGYTKSLETVKELYTNGDATKDDYTKALRAYQTYLGEIKSVQRDEAAAAREDQRYY